MADTPRRVLVVKLADVGDMVTATPALRLLRQRLPGAEVTVLATPQTGFIPSRLGLADRVIPFDKHRFDARSSLLRPRELAFSAGFASGLREHRFDAVVVMHHLTTRFGVAKYAALVAATGAALRVGLDNGRGWFFNRRVPDAGFGARHEVEYGVELVRRLGVEGAAGPVEFPGDPVAGARAEALLAPAGMAPVVALHPGSGAYSTARRWDPQRFAELAVRLHADLGVAIAIVGGPEERGLAESVARAAAAAGPLQLAGETSLIELGELLRRCRLVVSNDSGVGTLAAACETPVVSLFGPSNADAWAPWRPVGEEWKTVVLQHKLGCVPCFYRGTSLGHPEGCPPRTCLRLITVDEVAAAARELLRRGG